MTDTYVTWEEPVDPAACNADPERYDEHAIRSEHQCSGRMEPVLDSPPVSTHACH